jgi:hypothetical protein
MKLVFRRRKKSLLVHHSLETGRVPAIVLWAFEIEKQVETINSFLKVLDQNRSSFLANQMHLFTRDVFHLECCIKKEADLASVWRLRQVSWNAAL